MVGVSDIVITGIGCVSPIGIGRDELEQSLFSKRCAIELLQACTDPQRTAFYGARVPNFDGKAYVTPRKALKVMGREVQIAYSAAHLAWQDAALADTQIDAARVGVVFGSEMLPGDIADLSPAIVACRENERLNTDKWGKEFAKHVFPLWMLKYLPNMPACHVGIAVNARGPNNSIAQEEVSGLLALGEAADIIARDQADLMVVGAIGTRVTPTRLLYRAPGLYDQHPTDPQTENLPRCVPFDARRRGITPSEGSVALVIESRRHAMKRGAKILAVLKGHSSRYGRPQQQFGGSRQAIASAAADAMCQADIAASELCHVSAQGYSEKKLDIEEAAAIAEVAEDVPVTAFSSYFGTAGAACGLMELAASIIAGNRGARLPTLGFSQRDQQCPVNVCRERQSSAQQNILKLSFTPHGQAAAVVVQCMK